MTLARDIETFLAGGARRRDEIEQHVRALRGYRATQTLTLVDSALRGLVRRRRIELHPVQGFRLRRERTVTR